MRNALRLAPWVSLPVLAVALPGCMSSASLGSSSSISQSIGSLSESLSGSSKGLSESSGASSDSVGGEESDFPEDVRDYTTAYVGSGGSVTAYQRRLGELAEREGITNWEENPATYVAIGEGLARARATQGKVEAFKASVAAADPERQRWIQQGYDATRP
jgi:hypothetical protein